MVCHMVPAAAGMIVKLLVKKFTLLVLLSCHWLCVVDIRSVSQQLNLSFFHLCRKHRLHNIKFELNQD